MRLRRTLLWLCLCSLLLVTLFAHSAAWGRYEQRRAYQESPLSPLATPPTSPLTTTLPVTAPLSITAPITTAPVTAAAPITPPVIVSLPMTVSVPPPTPVPTALPTATATLINHGQISLLLVGAVLASILVVIAVIIGRRQ